ncbi:MAG: type II toxin-antitoxin system PemK/MazF family toxin [Gemmatimonadota bacterium]|nr:MAG: type II toxin-antitoxin system PemK/MazF family toxin [Gemmatimonadota bacterium]
MVVERGEVWWASLPDPRGAEPGFRRPVLIVQNDAFNRSRIQTVLAVVLTSNLRLLDAPGNAFIPKKLSRLPRDSVANVSQLITVDRAFLAQRSAKLPSQLIRAVNSGLRLVLDL